MKRYVIKLYDKSTSGAFVTQGEESVKHHGTPVAIVSGPIYCPTCKSDGYIVATGLRHHTSIMGKEMALENDLGMCKCRPPPRMIASQSTMSQSFTSDFLAAEGYTPSGIPLLRHQDEAITLRDHRTRRALANVHYRISDGSQVLATGVTDANGRTERVVTDTASNVVVEIQHDPHTGASRR
ncbi:PAAR domain-containing protein [Caballeronia sp. SBC2]|uniref:PAAR domain-containing protein n=1 Tax=Caballeronia sp. SBC2 TaxID=2705547 RepID=UPI0013E1C81F|nr:PAAR domain-containing protein [Caballeronia sp. SBC2]QIE22678.1 PAAR motif protein [Caballeronia sp. SBC2]